MSKKLSVRLDDENYNEMAMRAERNNTTIAREINRAIASSEVVDVGDDKINEVRSALTLMAAELTLLNTNMRKRGTNINTIAKKLNTSSKILDHKDNAIVLTNNISAYAEQDKAVRKQLETLAEKVTDLWQSLK